MPGTGTVVVDFGATPTAGGPASATVTGQTGILSSSNIEAWVDCRTASADHSADEHIVEDLECSAGNIVAGTGFTVYVHCRTAKTYGKWNIAWVWA